MEVKTEEGIAKPLPLSDVQQYNKILKRNTLAIEESNRIKNREFWLKCLIVLLIIALIIWLERTDFLYWVIRSYKVAGC